MSFLKLNAITSVERNLAISHVRLAISKHQGWIIDHTFLSNIAATIVFEMPGAEIVPLIDTLNAHHIPTKMDAPIAADQTNDLKATMSLTFIHDEPDMKRDVPHFG